MLTNYTKLADLYAIAKAEEDAAKKKVEALRKQILAEGREYLFGDAFTVQVSLSERASLDGKLARTFLTEAQVAECTKTTMVETLRVRAQVEMAA